MRVLLHTCCGPCTAYPLAQLRDEGHAVSAIFFNPNIHPYREFQRRVKTMRQYAELVKLPCQIEEHYDLPGSLALLMQEGNRCQACYGKRLEHTAHAAQLRGFDAFTTTLLVSPWQKHELVRECGEAAGRSYDMHFLYRDFRSGWEQGVAAAKRAQLYRQPYCGCVFSEYERFSEGSQS